MVFECVNCLKQVSGACKSQVWNNDILQMEIQKSQFSEESNRQFQALLAERLKRMEKKSVCDASEKNTQHGEGQDGGGDATRAAGGSCLNILFKGFNFYHY